MYKVVGIVVHVMKFTAPECPGNNFIVELTVRQILATLLSSSLLKMTKIVIFHPMP